MRLFTLYVISIAFVNYTLVPGVVVSRPPVLMGLVLIGWALLQTQREGAVPRPGPFGLMLIVFAATTVLNGAVTRLSGGNMSDYLRIEGQFLIALAIVFAFVRARLDAHAVARLLKAWVWVAALAALFGVYEEFARVLDLPYPTLPIAIKGYTGVHSKEFFGVFAITSWYGEPSWLGSFLLVPLLYVFGVLVLDPPPPYCFRKKWWAGGLAALFALALFLSLSQAAYASLAVAAIPVLWSLRERIRVGRMVKVTGTALALLTITAFVLGGGGANIMRAQWERVTAIAISWNAPERTTQITSYGVRMSHMLGGLMMWKSAPITGVGINQMPYVPAARRLMGDPTDASVDSGLVQLLVEQGILGFGALLLALAILWERLNRARVRASDPGLQFLLLFLMWGLLIDIVNSAVTHPWHHLQRWTVIALAASLLGTLEASFSAASETRGRRRDAGA